MSREVKEIIYEEPSKENRNIVSRFYKDGKCYKPYVKDGNLYIPFVFPAGIENGIKLDTKILYVELSSMLLNEIFDSLFTSTDSTIRNNLLEKFSKVNNQQLLTSANGNLDEKDG